jgi:hypothetical protein
MRIHTEAIQNMYLVEAMLAKGVDSEALIKLCMDERSSNSNCLQRSRGWDSNLKLFIKSGHSRFALSEAISALYPILLLASGTAKTGNYVLLAQCPCSTAMLSRSEILSPSSFGAICSDHGTDWH